MALDLAIGALEPSIDPILIPAADLDSTLSTARLLPSIGFVGFERSLGRPQASVDFAVGWRRADRESVRVAMRQGLGRHWSSVNRILNAWIDSGSPLYDQLGTLWLEFDSPADYLREPGVLIGITNPDFRSSLIDVLIRDSVDERVHGEIVRCCDALPEGVQVFQIGVMPSRATRGIRLCVASSSSAQLTDYLARIGWPGNVEDLRKSLEPLTALSHLMALGVDIGQELSPRIGVELYFDEQRQPVLDERWEAALEVLVRRHLCLMSECRALLSWPGRRQARILWTRNYLFGLNHVKLVCLPGDGLAAKVYFGFVEAGTSTSVAVTGRRT